jgi:type II secretion system (T2SS) protein M
MTLASRHRRAIPVIAGLLIAGIAFRFWPATSTTVVAAPADSAALAEQRLARLRDLAATVPAKEETLQKVSAELASREKALLVADTAAQAQAQLIQMLRRLGGAETPPIEIRSTELPAIRPFGDAYGEADVSVQIECRIDQLINFLASIGAQPELVATNDLRITSANAKEKTVGVRLTVAGIVPRKLVPGKRS